jgi:AmmeMemoRadiSam system protein B
MIRLPAVAGQFYPAEKSTLTEMISGLMPAVPAAERRDAIAVISPHAGYVYSGKVAGKTFSKVNIPEDVLIIGPNHHGYGASLALIDEGEWQTPIGTVTINTELSRLILDSNDNIESDAAAHRAEHSLEVQVPFLQMRQPNLKLSPLVVSRLSLELCLYTGRQLAAAIKELARPVLIIASSDMTHYESRESASRKDKQALSKILELDPEALYQTVMENGISMCGVIPTTIALAAARDLGASECQLVSYSDSGETSGDLEQVVGYAGLLIS